MLARLTARRYPSDRRPRVLDSRGGNALAKKESTRAPRHARSIDTVRAIVEATERILASDGPDAVTTARVAAVAGVSVETLNEFFATREALIKDVEERSWALAGGAITRKIAEVEGAPLGDAIAEVVIASMTVLAARGNLPGIDPSDAATREARRAVFESVAGFVETQLMPVRARLLPSDLRQAAHVVVKMVGVMTWIGMRDHPDEMADGTFQREVAAMVKRYLVG